MKHFITIAIITTSLFSFGQTNMFWNNYSTINPAMSGLQYQYHGAITASDNWAWNKGIEGLNANYNQRISGQHGVGINFSGNYYFFMGNAVTLNYNYQFDLKKAGKLSAGIGAGGSNMQLRKRYYDLLDSGQVFTPQNRFLLNLGVAYSWKNLCVGVSASDLTAKKSNPSNQLPIRWSTHVSYDFAIGEKFQLTPRALYTYQNGFQNLSLDLTTTFMNKYSLGIVMNGRDNFGVHAGWDVREKFRVSYLVSKQYSKLMGFTNSSNISHEITLGFYLKEKAPTKTISVNPSF